MFHLGKKVSFTEHKTVFIRVRKQKLPPDIGCTLGIKLTYTDANPEGDSI